MIPPYNLYVIQQFSSSLTPCLPPLQPRISTSSNRERRSFGSPQFRPPTSYLPPERDLHRDGHLIKEAHVKTTMIINNSLLPCTFSPSFPEIHSIKRTRVGSVHVGRWAHNTEGNGSSDGSVYTVLVFSSSKACVGKAVVKKRNSLRTKVQLPDPV